MSLSKDEIALYDRQIRLWGMATQLRLRLARVLVIGVGGVGTEIVKNLVLGGLLLIELLDNARVKEEDFGCQFFLPNNESVVGTLKLPAILPQIQELNPRVSLTVDTEGFATKAPEYFTQFDLVVATELTYEQMIRLDSITRQASIPLYLAGLHGQFGYVITDLVKHTSSQKLAVGNLPRQAGTRLGPKKVIELVELDKQAEQEIVTVVDEFALVEEALSLRLVPLQLNRRQLKRLSGALPLTFALLRYSRPTDPDATLDQQELSQRAQHECERLALPTSIVSSEYVELFARQAFTEYAPVAAVLGGALAQDIIQFFSQKESPINNVMVFDGHSQEMPIYTMY